MALSDHSASRNLYATDADKFVPFTAFIEVFPYEGKRAEMVHDLQKIADLFLGMACSQIDDTAGTGEADVAFDYANPVAHIPTFGHNEVETISESTNFGITIDHESTVVRAKQARIAIHGHLCRRSEYDKNPHGSRYVDNCGEIKQGNSAANAANLVPSDDLNAAVKQLKENLEAVIVTLAITASVTRIEMSGVIFGERGIHFPL